MPVVICTVSLVSHRLSDNVSKLGATPNVEQIGPFTYVMHSVKWDPHWLEGSDVIEYRYNKTFFPVTDICTGQYGPTVRLPVHG
jgi:hypothetical protein